MKAKTTNFREFHVVTGWFSLLKPFVLKLQRPVSYKKTSIWKLSKPELPQNTSFKNTVLHIHFAWKEKIVHSKLSNAFSFSQTVGPTKRAPENLTGSDIILPTIGPGEVCCIVRLDSLPSEICRRRSGEIWRSMGEIWRRKLMDTARPFFPRWAQDTARKKSSSGNSIEDSLVKVRCGAT